MKNLKKGLVSVALAGSFVLGIGALGSANAQDRRWERQRRNGQVESTGNIDRNRNGIDDRYETRDGRVDINRNGVADQDERNGRYRRNNGYYGNNGSYRNDGYYGNNGSYGNRNYGYNNYDFQKGYNDGLNRGREDALSNRAMTPNNSSHYRSGNSAYRAGFERGFFEAYRYYRNRGW